MNFGHGVLDISRDHIVSFMGAFVEGVMHPSFAMQHFSKPFVFLSFIMVQTLSAMCKERKSTSRPLEVRNTLSAICTGN
jgi:hypothetical protein